MGSEAISWLHHVLLLISSAKLSSELLKKCNSFVGDSKNRTKALAGPSEEIELLEGQLKGEEDQLRDLRKQIQEQENKLQGLQDDVTSKNNELSGNSSKKNELYLSLLKLQSEIASSNLSLKAAARDKSKDQKIFCARKNLKKKKSQFWLLHR